MRTIDRYFLRLIKLMNIGFASVPVLACWKLVYSLERMPPNPRQTMLLILLLFCVVYGVFVGIYNGYDLPGSKVPELIYSAALSAMISDVLLYLVFGVSVGAIPKIWPIPLMFLAQLGLAILWAVGAHTLYFAIHAPLETLVVRHESADVEGLLRDKAFVKRYHACSVITPEELVASGYKGLESYKVLILFCDDNTPRGAIARACLMKHVKLYLVPDVMDVLIHGATEYPMFHHSMLRIMSPAPGKAYDFLKRAADVLFSGITILLLSPIMLVTAAAIKLQDHGPIIYRQKRLTAGSRVFEIYKFRSMRVDAEKDGIARLSTGDKDDRITPVGRFIRAVRIDELPQLFNILKGDMTIVGPRPERPELTEEYSKAIPDFPLRLQVKAGLTGYAQIYGKYNSTPQEKLMMDLHYIHHLSVFEDLRLMFATVKVLLLPESTEGVDTDQTSALKNRKPKQKA